MKRVGSKDYFKLYLVLLMLFILLTGGYYEYIINVTIKSTKYLSFVNLNITAKSKSFQENVVGENKTVSSENVTCQKIPKGAKKSLEIRYENFL